MRLFRAALFALPTVFFSQVAAAQTSSPAPATTASSATPGSTPTPASNDPEAMINAALELRTQRRDEEALQLFQRAYAIAPTPRTLAQIALAEQALGHWVEAEQHMRGALSSPRDPWIARNAGPLRQAMTTIEAHLGRLEVRSNVEGAELWLGGARIGTLPMTEPVRVPIGAPQVQVRASGYVTATRTVTIAPGQLARESITLQPDTGSGNNSDPLAIGNSTPGGTTTGNNTGGNNAVDQQSRARTNIVFGVGAGFNFLLPIVGVGVRYGFFNNRFEIQGRVDAALVWTPFGIANGSTAVYHFLGPLVGVDGSFRVRPVSNTSPWYVGLGVVAKFGVYFPVLVSNPNPMTTPVSPGINLQPAIGTVIETGFLLGRDQRWDLSLRFLGGYGLLNGVISVGYSL